MKNQKLIFSIFAVALVAVAGVAFAYGTDFYNGSRYGNTPNNSGVTVNSTTTLVVALNAARVGMILTNAGPQGLYLAFGTNAVAATSTGIYLAPYGGSLQLDGQSLWQGAIQAISASATTTLTFTEI